jgi:hypothetical protein
VYRTNLIILEANFILVGTLSVSPLLPRDSPGASPPDPSPEIIVCEYEIEVAKYRDADMAKVVAP